MESNRVGFFDISESSALDLVPKTDDRGRVLPEFPRTDIFKQIWGEEGVPRRVRAYAFLGPLLAFSGVGLYLVNNPMTMRFVGMKYAGLLSMAVWLGFIVFLAWARGGKRFQIFGSTANQTQQYSPMYFALGMIFMLVAFAATGARVVSLSALQHPWAYGLAAAMLAVGFLTSSIGWRRAYVRQNCKQSGQRIRPDAELRRFSMTSTPLMIAGMAVLMLAIADRGSASLSKIGRFALGGVLLGVVSVAKGATKLKARNTSNPLFGSERLSAWLAANDRCGSCGYSLESAPIEADGVRLCPECGCAWHRDRVTHAAPAPEDKKRVIETLTRVDGLVLDDRGVPLARKVTSLGGWIDDSRLFGPNAELLTRHAGRLRVKRLREGAIAAGVGCSVIALLVFFATDFRDTGLIWTLFLFVGLAAIGGVVWHVFGTMPPDSICGPILASGLCPGCASSLAPAFDAGQTFDACVNCASCGLAWKRERVRLDSTRERQA